MNTIHEENSFDIERLILLAADSQSFITKKDKLAGLLKKHAAQMEDELCEDDLQYVAAAHKPAVPKYKTVNNLR